MLAKPGSQVEDVMENQTHPGGGQWTEGHGQPQRPVGHPSVEPREHLAARGTCKDTVSVCSRLLENAH